MSQTPTLGRIVLYTLGDSEAAELVKKYGDQIGRTLNQPRAGQAYPAMIVAVFSDTCVNLRVQLDGEPTYWATSRTLGEGEWRWAWPTIAPAAAPAAPAAAHSTPDED